MKVLGLYLTLTTFERDDIRSDAQARVLRRLQNLRYANASLEASSTPISDLRAYVSTVTINSRRDLIHSKQPEWRRVNHRILRLAEDANNGIGIENRQNGEDMVALVRHDGEGHRDDVAKLVEGVRRRLPNHLFLPIQVLVPAILEVANGGVARKDLVRAVLELTGAGNFEEVEMPDEINNLRVGSENEELIAERQMVALKQIWEKIRALPTNQRKVMLLSLRENRETEAVSLLLRKRIAAIREIADALEVSIEEFSAIFERLPMSSSEIADFLGIDDGEKTSKEQKVDNLRRIARDLLRRRLGIRK